MVTIISTPFITDELNTTMKMRLKPEQIGKVTVHYNPFRKGKTSCEIRLTIVDNPYEYFTVAKSI